MNAKTPTNYMEYEELTKQGWTFANIETWGNNHFLVVPTTWQYVRLRESMQLISVIDLHEIDTMTIWDGSGAIGGVYCEPQLTGGNYNRAFVQWQDGGCRIMMADNRSEYFAAGEIGIYLSAVPTQAVIERQMEETEDNPVLSPSAGGY